MIEEKRFPWPIFLLLLHAQNFAYIIKVKRNALLEIYFSKVSIYTLDFFVVHSMLWADTQAFFGLVTTFSEKGTKITQQTRIRKIYQHLNFLTRLILYLQLTLLQWRCWEFLLMGANFHFVDLLHPVSGRALHLTLPQKVVGHYVIKPIDVGIHIDGFFLGGG